MAYNESIGFGSGFMFMTPASGDPTPVRVGILQDISLDVSFDEKPLYGQAQWPVALARGKAKGACKATSARLDMRLIGQILLGGTSVAGQEQIVDLEAGAVPAVTTYTVQVAGHANFTEDLGVFYAATAQPLQQVAAGSEATGKYSVALTGGSKGTYTFAAGDASAAVLISYAKNDGTAGYKTTITNQPMGTVNYFSVDTFIINPEVPGSQAGARFYRCSSNKLSLATKQDDWLIPNFEFSLQANPVGKVMDWNTPI